MKIDLAPKTPSRPGEAVGILQPFGGCRFGTIMADPPWQFVNRTGKVAPASASTPANRTNYMPSRKRAARRPGSSCSPGAHGRAGPSGATRRRWATGRPGRPTPRTRAAQRRPWRTRADRPSAPLDRGTPQRHVLRYDPSHVPDPRPPAARPVLPPETAGEARNQRAACRLRLCAERRPAGRDTGARVRRRTRRAGPGAARRHRLGQDLHDGQGDRGGAEARR